MAKKSKKCCDQNDCCTNSGKNMSKQLKKDPMVLCALGLGVIEAIGETKKGSKKTDALRKEAANALKKLAKHADGGKSDKSSKPKKKKKSKSKKKSNGLDVAEMESISPILSFEGLQTTLDEPRNGEADDLKLIAGVGPKLEQTLNELGIYHFDQIAAWTIEEIDWVDDYLQFSGRIVRDNWVDQADALARGGRDEYVRVFGKEPR